MQATPDHSELVQRCGSPISTFQKLLCSDPELLDGIVPHLLGIPKEQRGVMEHLLKDFKGVFPVELPKYVSGDSRLGDVHKVLIKSSTESIARKMYCYSPKEQLLIK